MIRRITLLGLVAFVPLAVNCTSEFEGEGEESEVDPGSSTDAIISGVDCTRTRQTAYDNGRSYSIDVIKVGSKPTALATGHAFLKMQAAAHAAGVGLSINSGFRTMEEQQYFWNCYQTKKCNNGNLAARPGYSNHQNGRALDLTTSSWLAKNAGSFGFKRTVPSEDWHYEYFGDDPGGPCSATRTTCPGFKGGVAGAIGEKYRSLGGCSSALGGPLTDEEPTADHVGRYNHFQHGSIYWTPDLGAHAVQGAIFDKWEDLEWETGLLGYPTTDELKTPDNRGRYSVFQRGSIYWTEKTGAHEVHGTIRDAWKESGWEAGPLGYPTSDEITTAGGAKSTFEGGEITWDAATNKATVTLNEQ